MQKYLLFLKGNALALAMLIGVLGFKWFRLLSPCLATLIFLMLFFTFCKINPIDLRLHKWHWLALIFQLTMSIFVFYVLKSIDIVLAQGVMLCFIMPSATAAPIIAGKLGGSIQSLTSFTMLSNIATAIVVPAFFPIVNPATDMIFFDASLLILRKITPLLLGPFFAAWLLRIMYNTIQKMMGNDKHFHLGKRWAELPFYLWAFSLVVLMAQITFSLVYDDYNPWVVILQAIGALIACLTQFFVGKKIGEKYPSKPHGEDYMDDSLILFTDTQIKDSSIMLDEQIATEINNPNIYQTRISAGQALGQKNTTLGIWMAHTYLNPIAALGTAAYIVWQNVFNSWQLARAAKGQKV